MNNLVIVPVVLNGQLPLKFILDTGVRTTILTERSFSDLLKLNYGRHYMVAGPGGDKVVEAYVTNNVTLDLPGCMAKVMLCSCLKRLSGTSQLPGYGCARRIGL